ncbi:glycoside hydrolase family 13 protein [Nakamurella flava]|uniref:Glycoside hydrolase family 13 protein n=1 Tax=Nakamurella flava TaxID=2576308 RepID=A0A4U6QJY4_9ACTN|nr:glycoside hydrolase family 13 protein [Nakamurella flava]TKV60412.1 glycoside hydrolase family 13 protein [Nakamurella flava]
MSVIETNTLETVSAAAGPESGSPADDWRRTAVVYQIYPRSFADGDGDGIGDLPGIIGRLGALAELGVDAVWLSPFYKSPQADAGYDVADYRDIDPLFGTLDDFDALVAKAHDLGLKVIIDLVPNHSSDEHVWFQQALAAGPGSPERERYIFRDGLGERGELPPNNWVSCFRGPAWTRTTNADGTPGQWYLHLFDTKQPDWNWEHPEVREEFLSVLRFWLDRGADGFRVDVAHALIKAPGLPDLVHPIQDPEADPEGFFMNGPMWDQDRVHEVYQSWRALLDEYSPDRILCAEAWVQPLSRLANYVRPDEMHQAFNFEYLDTPWNAAALRTSITASVASNESVGAPTTWVLSNHDVVRHASRLGLPGNGPRPNGIRAGDVQPDAELGLRRARAATLLMLALPGSAYLYQGEELGLPDHTDLDDDLRQDPTWWRSEYTEAGRDGCRVPLPWQADAPGLGFGPTGLTWLPQPEAYTELARDRQLGVAGSTLEMYRTALRLRREYGLGPGSLEWADDLGSGDVLSFVNGQVRVAANIGTTPVALLAGATVVHSSVELPGDGTLPPDTTVWLV